MAKRSRPPIAAQHADWLGLLETSGPFVSLPVLVAEMPQGLDAIETERRRPLRARYQEWELDSASVETHGEWVTSVIHDLLEHDQDCVTLVTGTENLPDGLSLTVAEHSEKILPTLVIHESGKVDAKSARVLVFVVPAKQRVDRKPTDSSWTASVNSRAAELCRSSGVRLGLVTNGEQWVLIDAPKDETVGYATWHARLWFDEPSALDGFAALLGRHRLFSVADEQTLEGLLDSSRKDQHEVTDQLGLQVRRAVEMLVRTLDRSDQDLGGELLKELEAKEIYEAAVTVMMRLVFLFSAEERGLLLLGDPLFDQHYAVSTLCEQLREVAEQHGEEILERRRDAWCRLLAAFRCVHSGVHHDRLRIPAYGGGLFDPDKFPFLEGRQKGTTWQDTTADPLPVDNRTVLHCLESLQYLQTKIGKHVESRRLSFRALDIEQIGHVYEGLLDHTAVRANGPTLGLFGKAGDEPEMELTQLEALVSQGRAKLIESLAEFKVKSSKKSVEKLLDADLDASRAETLRRACKSDGLWNRVEPFASLIRDDDFGHPIVILEGQLFATAGLDRRSTGTHYTPRSLTEPIVEHTLEPLVYEGPAEGTPREQWKLRSPKEILKLKVCDMACGSGAFLVQACRYLGDRLMESWAEAERRAPEPNPGKLTFPTIDYEGMSATSDRNLVPKDLDERLLTARRLLAQRCLYGVDINPVAAEMAKLSIWLLTLSKDKPFSFLDHAIQSGDSLLGIHDIRQLRRFSLDPDSEIQTTFSSMPITELIEQASDDRIQIEQLDSDSIGHVRAQARLLDEAEAKTQRLRFAADMLISGYVQPASNAGAREDQLRHAAVKAGQLTLSGSSEDMQDYARRALLGKRPFHWCLEFPEVNSRGGFDAIVGNPPFKGGKKLSGLFGSEYRELLVNHLANGIRGNADLAAYFMRRIVATVRAGGTLGAITTNTIAQGETRQVGLQPLVVDGLQIYRAVSSRPWPGSASLEVSIVWARKGEWNGPLFLDDTQVAHISSSLTKEAESAGTPFELRQNDGQAFQGSNLRGVGFAMQPEEAGDLIAADAKNAEVLFPYYIGDDVNGSPSLSASRYVINFFDWEQDQAELYPAVFEIARERVLPERERIKHEGTRAKGVRYFWRYDSIAKELYRSIANNSRILAVTLTSKHHAFAFLPPGAVYGVSLVVFAHESYARFAQLSSSLHMQWIWRYGGKLETRPRYFPKGCFRTFPFCSDSQMLEDAGRSFYLKREQVMLQDECGLLDIHNQIHNPEVASSDVIALRDDLAQIDSRIVAEYGWSDLGEELEHDFYPTVQGVRFTVRPDVANEMLARLLALNHRRYKEEVQAGLHDKKSNSKAKKKTAKRMSKKSKGASGAGLFKDSAT